MRLVLILLFACSTPEPKTPASMLAYRLSHAGCKRVCPVGERIEPIEPQADHILDDCCVDPNGLGWASCAWNGTGRFMTREQLLAAPLGGCGGPGYPDCEGR